MSYLFQKRPDDLFIEIQDKLKRSGITETSIDSISNILADIVTGELSSTVSEFNARLDDFNLSTASGEALDNLVFNLYGFSRFQSSKAYSENNFRFINNSGADVDIPPGTKISTGNAFSLDGIVYETINDSAVTVQPSNSEYIPVLAIEAGSSYNVSEGSLTNHELDIDGLSCTNNYAIVNGSDTELDSSFRLRAINYIQSATNSNLEYLRFRLLSVPGVFNLKFVQGYRGIGSMSVFAVTSGNRTDDRLKEMLEARIQEVSMPGDKIYYEQGTEARVGLDFLMINNRNFTEEEIARIKFTIREECAKFFVRAKRVNSLDFSQLEGQIKRSVTDYNFLINDNQTIYKQITITKEEPNATTGGGSTTTTMDLENGNLVHELAIRDVPVLGTVDIEVSLNL